MRRVLAALALVGALVGCGDPQTVATTSDPTKTTYSRDVRTGICFATLGRKSVDTRATVSWSFSVTAVPCSREVLALIPAAQGGTLVEVAK